VMKKAPRALARRLHHRRAVPRSVPRSLAGSWLLGRGLFSCEEHHLV